ncbi:hypothetical protein HUN37_14660, partial [Acinetobacter bereziniae]|nr:hypothetical protein [Acinetobacter bereziniae]NUG64717.1 hypothetical protein [Acinetobacter bereziniae]
LAKLNTANSTAGFVLFVRDISVVLDPAVWFLLSINAMGLTLIRFNF